MTEPYKAGFKLTLLLCAGLVITQMAQGLLITASKNADGGYDYDRNVSVMLSEICKFLVSASLLLYQSRSTGPRPKDAPPLTSKLGRETLRFAVPGIIYALHNNIIFTALEMLSPVTYQLFNNLKIVTTGLVFRLFLRRPLRVSQWMAIILLPLSMCVTQLTMGGWGEGAAPSPTDERILEGFLWMLALCSCSAFAGVYNEFLLKNGVPSSLMWKNMQLYSFGALACAFPYLHSRWNSIDPPPMLQGFGPMAWGVVLLNGMLGQIISAIFLYADSIVKVYAASGTVLLTPLVSNAIFGTELHAPLFLGIGIALVSLFLYFLPVRQLSATDAELVAGCRKRDEEIGVEERKGLL